jgi:hypothetical protein
LYRYVAFFTKQRQQRHNEQKASIPITMTDQELDYRNLVNCRVEIITSTNTSQQAVSLPQECYQAANIQIPTPYDFALGTSLWDSI